MEKSKVITTLERYAERCREALNSAEYDGFYSYYVPAATFDVLKTSIVSFFNQLNVDQTFIKNIEKLNKREKYELETILNYVLEIKELIQNNSVESFSIPVYKDYDVFLSHANKDKKTFVRELKKELEKLDISIFYDEDSLAWGDDWEKRIDDALNKCEFAIVVLSKNFFGRAWTEKELNSLLERKNALGQKLILPIIHGTSIRTIKKKYPQIASIQAIQTSNYSAKDIALLFAGQLISRLKESKKQ